MQYGKKDSEGNSTYELLNPQSQALLGEWTNVVKDKYGKYVVIEDNDDADLYLNIPSVMSRKKKGRIFGYGSTKHAYLKLGASTSSQQGNNSAETSQEQISKEEEEAEKNRLAKRVEMLDVLVGKQEKKIEMLLKFLVSKLNCELPDLDTIDEDMPAQEPEDPPADPYF